MRPGAHFSGKSAAVVRPGVSGLGPPREIRAQKFVLVDGTRIDGRIGQPGSEEPDPATDQTVSQPVFEESTGRKLSSILSFRPEESCPERGYFMEDTYLAGSLCLTKRMMSNNSESIKPSAAGT